MQVRNCVYRANTMKRSNILEFVEHIINITINAFNTRVILKIKILCFAAKFVEKSMYRHMENLTKRTRMVKFHCSKKCGRSWLKKHPSHQVKKQFF